MNFLKKFFILILLAFVNIEVNSMNSNRSKSVDPDEREFTILKDFFEKHEISEKELDEIVRSGSVPNFGKIKSRKSGLEKESESYELMKSTEL